MTASSNIRIQICQNPELLASFANAKPSVNVFQKGNRTLAVATNSYGVEGKDFVVRRIFKVRNINRNGVRILTLGEEISQDINLTNFSKIS